MNPEKTQKKAKAQLQASLQESIKGLNQAMALYGEAVLSDQEKRLLEDARRSILVVESRLFIERRD